MNNLRHCPICNASPEGAAVFVDETVDMDRMNSFSFSSRKEPEYMSHKMVRCPGCDLVYVVKPPRQDELARAYHQADYDSSEEADDAAKAYIKATGPILERLTRRESALEIGTGTGVFLEYLQRAGFKHLVGVEPSRAAIDAAPPNRRAWIREGIFVEADFPPASFDLICCFMTMEHVSDPSQVAHAALRLLRSGGAFVTVTHDYQSWVNRAMGRRSPIIDVEHMQLFSTSSVRRLFESCNYQRVSVSSFVNAYSLRYWVRLMPLPASIKRALSKGLATTHLDGIRLGFNVGNVVTAGFKGT
jgi:SAM-dependent methyltransferase